MEKSFAVMECLIPEHKKLIPINSASRNIMMERLKSEYVVYNYVKERLERQYEECRQRGLPTNGPVTRKQ